MFQTLEQQHQQEWIHYLQCLQRHLDHLQITVSSSTSLQSCKDQQLNEFLANYSRVHCLAWQQHAVFKFLRRQYQQQSQAPTTSAAGSGGIFTTATAAAAVRDWDITTVTTRSRDWIFTTATAAAGHH